MSAPLSSSGHQRIGMSRIEVDFESSDAMVEGAVNEIVDRIADRDCHHHWDHDRKEDAAIHNSAKKLQNDLRKAKT
jgi:hypothetical protein